MQVRGNATRSIVTGLAGIAGLVLLICFSSSASAQQTMIYHGNGFAIEPVNLYNWEYDGHPSGMSGGQTIAGFEGSETNRWPEGKMAWKRWGKNSATGQGGLHTHCGTLTERECRRSPWYGTPDVKVRAYAPKSGHFTKIKVTSTGEGPRRSMVLRFLGRHLTPAWKIVREDAASRGRDGTGTKLSDRARCSHSHVSTRPLVPTPGKEPRDE